MGVEVKSGGEGVIVADRGCNDGCCCNGRNSGRGAVGGALVGGGFAAATSRTVNRKSSALSKIRLKTRKSLVSTEW